MFTMRIWKSALLLFLCTTGLSAQVPAIPAAGMISWWPGDHDASDIYGSNNGTLAGGASAGAPGYVGGAFLFDGTNGYCTIADVPSLHPTNLTVMGWLRCDALNTPAVGGSYPGEQYVVFHQNDQAINFEGFTLAKDREPRYTGTNDTWCFDTTSDGGDSVFVESQTLVATNVWYHVAGVRGSNYLQIYINGKLEAQTNVDFPIAYGDHPLCFATTGETNWDHRFAGALDEVMLFDRALSADEIHTIYAAGHAGAAKTPTAVSLALSAPTNSQVFPAVTIAGIPGQSGEVQDTAEPLAASNNWVPQSELTLTATSNVWVDTNPATGPRRYYRVITNAP